MGSHSLPVRTADGTISRNNISVSFFFAPTPSIDEEAALAHFLPRTAALGAFFTFDPAIHAENPSFAPGSPCSEQIPWEASVYAVASADMGNVPLSLTLVLVPASVRDAHAMVDVSLKWDPDAAREVARRRAAGEPLGTDARRRLAADRGLGTVGDSKSIGLNWNGIIGSGAAAEQETVEAFPSPGLLTCSNCFAYLGVSYSVSFQYCIGLEVANQMVFFTSENSRGDMTSFVVPFQDRTVSSSLTAANMADCVTALAPWEGAGDYGGGLIHMKDGLVYANAALNVDAVRGTGSHPLPA